MFQIKVKLLEYNEGEFEGNKYSNVMARYDGDILKFKLDRKNVADCSVLVDHDVELSFTIVKGQNSSAMLRVLSVKEVKE